MAKKSRRPTRTRPAGAALSAQNLTSSVDELLLAALERGDESFQTGRYLITYKEGAAEQAALSLGTMGIRAADARDFADQAVAVQDVGDAEALFLPEVGVAVVTGDAVQTHGLSAALESAADSPVEAIEPEYFAFSSALAADYLSGFLRATQTIATDLADPETILVDGEELDALVLGATWGLTRCRVPPSARSGAGIRVAVLDTGMDLGHPDFGGRPVVRSSFVGQPVQDLHGHGTHCMGTACGAQAPPGTTPRYGIAYRASMYVGKVLSNSGGGTMGSVLAGMNWAIANRCTVISMSLGAPIPVQAAYTAAGAAALARGCLIVAAAGNDAAPTGAPANSPTIMSVAALDANLRPSSFSNSGKIEIAAPGRDVFSSWPRPTRYRTISGTSMATPHVAGCAALWAETSSSLRGPSLWKKLQSTARPLPFPRSKVGAGLVQAP